MYLFVATKSHVHLYRCWVQRYIFILTCKETDCISGDGDFYKYDDIIIC